MAETALIGTMIYALKGPDSARMLKAAGMDFFIIDNEHGMYSWESIERIAGMAAAVGIRAFVRIPLISREHIGKSLDCGAVGLIIPYIKDADQVREAVRLAKYPPLGVRGVALGRSNTAFARPASEEAYMEQANRDIVILPQIETCEAVDRMEEIAAVPGISGLFLGPRDLSCARGITDINDPYITEALERMIALCRARGLRAAGHLSNISQARKWLAMGIEILSYSGDAAVMMNGYKAILRELKP